MPYFSYRSVLKSQRWWYHFQPPAAQFPGSWIERRDRWLVNMTPPLLLYCRYGLLAAGIGSMNAMPPYHILPSAISNSTVALCCFEALGARSYCVQHGRQCSFIQRATYACEDIKEEPGYRREAWSMLQYCNKIKQLQ